jgi:hypothetical protein
MSGLPDGQFAKVAQAEEDYWQVWHVTPIRQPPVWRGASMTRWQPLKLHMRRVISRRHASADLAADELCMGQGQEHGAIVWAVGSGGSFLRANLQSKKFGRR